METVIIQIVVNAILNAVTVFGGFWGIIRHRIVALRKDVDFIKTGLDSAKVGFDKNERTLVDLVEELKTSISNINLEFIRHQNNYQRELDNLHIVTSEIYLDKQERKNAFSAMKTDIEIMQKKIKSYENDLEKIALMLREEFKIK